jgi:hypothetical protein
MNENWEISTFWVANVTRTRSVDAPALGSATRTQGTHAGEVTGWVNSGKTCRITSETASPESRA